MDFNWLVLFGSAFVPLLVGMVWYNPKVFGKAWIASTGLTEEQLRQSNMWIIFGLTYLFGIFIAFTLSSMVIHQMHFFSIFADDPTAKDPNSEMAILFQKYGGKFRTFKHGAFHGILVTITMALPITGIIAMFERKSFKYIAIHTGFWALTLMLMGGIICQWL